MRLIRFNIATEDLIDPNTIRVQFDIVNTDSDGKTLIPVSPPHGFFSRARLLSRGVVVEDISNYNRVHEMLEMLKSAGTAHDDMMESFLTQYER